MKNQNTILEIINGSETLEFYGHYELELPSNEDLTSESYKLSSSDRETIVVDYPARLYVG